MKNHQTIYLLIWAGILLTALIGCNSGSEPVRQNVFSAPEVIEPPVVIKAGEPAIHHLSDNPPPQIIDLLSKPAPVKISVDFFVTMQNFNTEHGLALSSILSGFKDRSGNLWFGTFGNGVSKYDGKTFTNYNSSHGLIHNLIEAITQDSEGNIWFSTYGGASKYNGVYFENFTTRDGLPANHINKILEDARGNIWVATRGGLSRNNPDKNDNGMSQFILYEDTQGFTGNHARDIIEDRNNNLWVSGQTGVFKVVPAAGTHGETSLYDYSEITGLENEIVYRIAEDRDGMLWFATSKGAVRFDPDNVQMGRSAATTYTMADGLISNSIVSILEDRAGNIWFGSEEGVSEFIKENSSFINYTTEQGLAGNDIVCMVEDQAGSLWFGTKNHGLSRFDGRSTIEYTAMQGLPGKTIYSATEAPNGDIWIGAEDGGLTKFTKDRENLNRGSCVNFSTAQGLSAGNAMNMMFDKNGNLWFGSGYGLNKYDSKTITTWGTAHGLITNSVTSLAEDSKGNIWFGTYEGGLSMFDGKSFSNYTTEQGLVHNTVWNIHEDNTGVIWFATRGGLSRFDGENFINFTTAQGLPDNKLSIVTEDHIGNLLIGSWGGGVSIIRKEWVKMLSQGDVSQITQNIFENYNTSHGLPNDVIYEIIEDEDNNIIIGTSNGLTILKGGLHTSHEQIAKEGVEHFNQQTGYPIKDVSNNYSMLVDRDGFIWAGTGDKLVRFDYREVRKNTMAPQVIIQSVGINHTKISWHSLQIARAREVEEFQSTQRIPAYVHNELIVFGKRLTESERDTLIHKFRKVGFDRISPFNAIPQNLVLPYTHNTIGFDFVGIETTKPFLAQYQFQLEGSETQWSPPTTRNTAEYSNLRQGTYTFKVRAKSPDGIWSEPIGFGFRVLPPWWFTWWAIFLYVSLFILVLYGIRRYEMNRIHFRNQLRMEKVTTDSLRNLDHLKTQFFTNISHEFRTPLTLILGPIEKMREEARDSKIQKNLSLVYQNAEKLLTLINQLLELSKLESGNYQLKASTGDLISLMKSLVMSFASRAEQKNIKLEFNFDPQLRSPEFTDHFYFDHDIIEKIVNNLLSNAFKFTPENGHINVEACLNRLKDNGQVVEVIFRDSGIGIPAEKLPFIFDRFYQVDASTKRDYDGSGIGLALVKELVDQHKGSIIAKSRPGKGTTFSLRLPFGKEHYSSDQIAGKPSVEVKKDNGNGIVKALQDKEQDWQLSPDNGTNGPLVLVVDDHAEVRHFIAENLVEHFRVQEAENALEGQRLAIDMIPDLVISDVMMPGMDGFEFCEKLKTDERTSHIPVVLLTARTEDPDRMRGLETGADDYLTKPFNPKELLIRATNLMENRRLMREKFSTNAIIKPSEISVTSRDRAFMEKLMGIMEKNMDNEKFSVEDLAREAGMSQSQLHRKLKALINQTANHFIRSVRMHRAMELLEKNAGNIAEIAYMVGYVDPGYFTKSFKSFFGKLPSEISKT
jgi:signal transduction histidine kinase/ligand-binding sensor domain-containing protein/DNA-binding response OmpR family regulator